jgi:hypothetical protein
MMAPEPAVREEWLEAQGMMATPVVWPAQAVTFAAEPMSQPQTPPRRTQ